MELMIGMASSSVSPGDVAPWIEGMGRKVKRGLRKAEACFLQQGRFLPFKPRQKISSPAIQVA
ncbi:MAG: hypothetical protein KGP27_15095 [Hyphomicrobiales bacterium]|nr:hypothetical protein [Hyphomicrobiales bacterium]